MAFFDRFTGQEILELPENSIEGHFVDLETGEIVLTQKGKGKSYLVNPKWNDDKKTQFDCITQSIQVIAKNYRESLHRSPLIPPELAQQAILLELENALVDILKKGHLHTIANRPRLDVHYEDNVVVLPRAKRLAKSALTHLSSHSDCWQRKTVNGILPRKVLAEFSEDFYEIYENRLYKCLLDRLDNYLTKRLRWITYLKNNLEAFLNFQNAEMIDFRLRNRICALWGENYQNDDLNTQLDSSKEALDIIEKQLKVIKGLKQVGLYTQMPSYTHIPNQLRRTNILNHDEHYQHLPKLWDKLNQYEQNVLSPEQEQQWARDFQNDYEDYIVLLIERAVEYYQFNNVNKTFVFAGVKYYIKRKNHCVMIQDDEKNIILTMIPIANQMDNVDIEHKENVIFCGLFEQDNVLQISPMDLYVLEKMKDKIHSLLYQILGQNYAQEIKPVPSKIREFAEQYDDFFELSTNNGVKIIKPLSDDCYNEFNLLLTDYCNEETKIKFEKQFKHLLQIQNLCGCEQPMIDFKPNSNGFYQKCQNCLTIYRLVDNEFYKEMDKIK